jgi:hypothetical protein
VGVEIDQDEFSAEDRRRFAARLDEQVAALELLLARPGFGAGPRSLGAELEVSLVDGRCRPLGINRTVLAETRDPRLNLEVDRFNLELNTRPVPCAGRPFTALRADLAGGLAELGRRAATHGGRVIMIGILPTLVATDLGSRALTDSPRYRALSAGLRALRQEPFAVAIDGEDPLTVTVDDVTMQGANTSFQMHLRVTPDEFGRAYNAAQIATAPALAVAGNAPLFLGHRLWEETRIALCRQSVDDRVDAGPDEWRPARVSFGHGWARAGAVELFAESVALYAPLLPVLTGEDALAHARAGEVPALEELRLHHGTVWRWNRAVYDPADGGQLRIELRALPAGPTLTDMLANAAFLIGLTLGLAPAAESLVRRLTFGHARRNFYQAARHGLDAELLWPAGTGSSPRPTTVRELIPRLLPVARRGLAAAGVTADESEAALAVIAERVARGVTGARWQRRVLAALERDRPRAEALVALAERYLDAAASERPVHEWPVAP